MIKAVASEHKTKQRRASPSASVEERLWLHSRVSDNIADGVSTRCWLFESSQTKEGYASIGYQSRLWSVHRLAHVHFIGAIPNKYQVDHLCRVRNCWNPEHLEAVLPVVNFVRSANRGAFPLRTGHCQRGHKWTEENVTKYRQCRECMRLTDKARYPLRKRQSLKPQLPVKSILEIRRLGTARDITVAQIATLHSVSIRTVWRIIRRETWANVEDTELPTDQSEAS